MRFYPTEPPFYCGIDLHARTMYVCILSQRGEVLVHRHMNTDPDTFLSVIAPYRQGIVVAVEWTFTWDLARRPLHRPRHPFCPRSCPLHESHPWRQGHT